MNVWKLCITYSRSFRILAVVLISISGTQVHDVNYERTRGVLTASEPVAYRLVSIKSLFRHEDITNHKRTREKCDKAFNDY